MSPFWWLVVGLGVAFLITSGRAQAAYQVISGPIDIQPTSTNPSYPGGTGVGPQGQCQSYTPPKGADCRDGYIMDVQTGMCVCYGNPGTSTGTGVPG